MKLQLLTACVAVITLAGCDAASGIGPEGGTVVSEDGRLSLDIPEGALAEPVDITIEEVELLPDDALGPAYRVLPAGTVFEAPVTVLYNFGARGMEVDPGQIMLVGLREHEQWSRLPDRRIFAEEGLISASALYSTTFCVVEAQ